MCVTFNINTRYVHVGLELTVISIKFYTQSSFLFRLFYDHTERVTWRGADKVLVGRPEGKIQFGRPRRRWEDNITRWFKYDRDKLWLVYTQSVPVIFEPPCIISLREGWGGMDWIDLAKDWERWRAVVNEEWTFGFHKTRGIYWLAKRLLASQEGLCSMGLVS